MTAATSRKLSQRQMNNHDESERARFAALWYLGRQMLTESELRQKLLKKAYASGIIESTLDEMKQLGYINDRDYAQNYIGDAVENKKLGAVRIRLALMRKGVGRELIDEALSSLNADAAGTLRQLIEQKSRSLDLSDRKHRERLVGFLVRRGYRYDEIGPALREYQTEDMEETEFD